MSTWLKKVAWRLFNFVAGLTRKAQIGQIFAKLNKKCNGQKKAEQEPFTTEALKHGIFTLFFSVTSRLRGSKNVQPIADYYKTQ